MDLNKEIRETIAFYCGGTYENRKLAADKILQICNKKQLPINGVVKRFFTLNKQVLTEEEKDLKRRRNHYPFG